MLTMDRWKKRAASALAWGMMVSLLPLGLTAAPQTVEASGGSTDINGVVQLNYYLDADTQADVYFQIGSGHSVSNWTIEAEVTGTSHDDSATISGSGEHKLTLPIGSLGTGSYTVDLQVLDSSNTVKYAEQDTLTIFDPPGGTDTRITQIDRNKRIMLVDGQPFFPLGVFGGNNEVDQFNVNNLQRIKDAGFNFTMRWKENATIPEYDPALGVPGNEATVHDYLDAVDAAGLYAFEAPVKLAGEEYYEAYDDTHAEWLENSEYINTNVVPGVVELAKHHPAVIGYYSYDEPDNRYECCPTNSKYKVMEDGVEEFYSLVKSADPYHSVLTLFAVGLSKNQDWDAWDVPGRNFYLMEEASMSELYDAVKDSSDIAAELNQPYIFTPMLEKSSGRAKPLTAEEQRAQTYLALIGGAKGLFWWEWPATSHANWEAIQDVLDEINSLLPMYMERDPEQYSTYDDYGTEESVRVLMKNYDGDTYMIVANAENADVNVTYDLPSQYNGLSASNVHDGGNATFSGGSYTEQLGPYERRVYKFNSVEWVDGDSFFLDVSVGATQAVTNPVFAPVNNYVVNSGFEESWGTAQDWPIGWTPHNSMLDSGENGNTTARWTLDDSEAYEGSQSMKLTKHFPGIAGSPQMDWYGHAPMLSQTVAVPSSGTYKVSMQVKASQPDTKVWVWLGGNLVGNLDVCAGVTTCVWEELEYQHTGSSVPIRIVLREQGTLWVDAVQVESGSHTTYVNEGTVADTVAPLAPDNVDVESVTHDTIYVKWDSPYDNAGVVKEFEVYVNGNLVGTTNLRAYEVSGLSPNTQYTITVKAIDAANNKSAASDSAKDHQSNLPVTLGAPSVLFTDDFENGASAWTVEFGSSWAVTSVDGSDVYSQTNGTPQSGAHFVSAGQSTWDDYKVTAELKKTNYHNIGLAGRVVSDTQYYVLRTSTNTGEWLLERINGNNSSGWVELASGPIDWNTADWFTFGLEFDDDNIKVYINDILKTTYTDSSSSKYSSGKIGLRTHYSAGHFDDVEVAN